MSCFLDTPELELQHRLHFETQLLIFYYAHNIMYSQRFSCLATLGYSFVKTKNVYLHYRDISCNLAEDLYTSQVFDFYYSLQIQNLWIYSYKIHLSWSSPSLHSVNATKILLNPLSLECFFSTIFAVLYMLTQVHANWFQAPTKAS